MSSEVQKVDSVKTYPVIVKKRRDGLYQWAYPTHGAMDSYKLSHVEQFMKSRGLEFKVVVASEEETE